MADVPLYVALHQDTVKLYRDMSGASLHRCGLAAAGGAACGGHGCARVWVSGGEGTVLLLLQLHLQA